MITSDRWTTLMNSLCKYSITISTKSTEIIHWFNINNIIYHLLTSSKVQNSVWQKLIIDKRVFDEITSFSHNPLEQSGDCRHNIILILRVYVINNLMILFQDVCKYTLPQKRSVIYLITKKAELHKRNHYTYFEDNKWYSYLFT